MATSATGSSSGPNDHPTNAPFRFAAWRPVDKWPEPQAINHLDERQVVELVGRDLVAIVQVNLQLHDTITHFLHPDLSSTEVCKKYKKEGNDLHRQMLYSVVLQHKEILKPALDWCEKVALPPAKVVLPPVEVALPPVESEEVAAPRKKSKKPLVVKPLGRDLLHLPFQIRGRKKDGVFPVLLPVKKKNPPRVALIRDLVDEAKESIKTLTESINTLCATMKRRGHEVPDKANTFPTRLAREILLILAL
ncbi:hypothetical protein P153DRAFT_388059 [Dothidotthia symphoricarpi CBS 119687]|uniref:Uncharacterized protein n=1 Tax=Dothidotthia symphoricarpi CBS 119687 TaxID=1392245 RepID=A0A6A6A6C8_9PLEO|nr:uncharacterized protein P153DRAFT_388059 [Dothidotthia symphoricarpi CBS 119687]KAF2126735.1 hypothetical protein P153DRAFT_388059 [Dothidotthia symphoricarpi CBS 119687]